MCTSNSNGNCYCGVVGIRFCPSDEEILGYYLWHKMIGNDDLTLAISEVQLLQWEPWQLPPQSAIKSDDHVWFFFCRRDKKYANSQRDNRKTKKGFWKVTGNDRTICARDTNKPIGTKKTLVYHEGRSSNAVGTSWVIHEYRPTADTIPPNRRDFVVCRLEGKPDEKNSPSFKGECGGSSTASTSNNKAANNALPERGPHLEANTGPFVGNNAMDYELAVQASMEEQGLFEERGLFVEERQNPKENDFNYENVLIFESSSNDSAAGTSYRRNFRESAQKDTSITTRTFKSQYQPRSTPLTENAPRSTQLQSGFSSKNAVSEDKSNKGREMDQEKKTKEDSSGRSSESTGSNRGRSSIFKETTQSTSTPSPSWVYICKVILGVILFAIILIDGVGRH